MRVVPLPENEGTGISRALGIKKLTIKKTNESTQNLTVLSGAEQVAQVAVQVE